MKLVYPATFKPFSDGIGYVVEFPDLPGCVTEGKDLAESIEMAQDVACGWVLDEIEDGNKVPVASELSAISFDGDGFINLIVLDMDSYADKYGTQLVKKNVTIPAYLNTFGAKQGLNFSQILTEALMDKSRL